MNKAEKIIYDRLYRQTHKKQALITQKAWRDKNQSLGLCTICGKKADRAPLKICSICAPKKARLKKKSGLALKMKAMQPYGLKCACCNENELAFLTIDHVNNDGYLTPLKTSLALYRLVIKEGWPKQYRVLCFNCNTGRHINGGTCPHGNGI